MAVKYKTIILKFGKKGEKTGWTYIDLPLDIAGKLKKGEKKSFRVKGKLDDFKIEGVATLPMGNGDFIIPINAQMRKGIKKKEGAILEVQLEVDKSEFKFNEDLMLCLEEETAGLKFFKTLSGSHQRYFSKWIDSAKTEETKAKRISMAVNALVRKMGYPEMLRESKNNK
jgi:hypothetical protein